MQVKDARFSKANKQFDFGRLVSRDDVGYNKAAAEYLKEKLAEKQKKHEEQIWIEVRTIEEAKAKENDLRYRDVMTVEKINAKARQERIEDDTRKLPTKLTGQYKQVKKLKKDIKHFLEETESISKKIIAEAEQDARKDRKWQMEKLQDLGL